MSTIRYEVVVLGTDGKRAAVDAPTREAAEARARHAEQQPTTQAVVVRECRELSRWERPGAVPGEAAGRRRVLLINGRTFVFRMVPRAEQPNYLTMRRAELEQLMDWAEQGTEPPAICEEALQRSIDRLRAKGVTVEDMS